MCLKRQVKWLLFTCLFSLSMNCHAVQASTGYDALDDAAVAIKAPGHTPLIAASSENQRLFAVGVHGVIVMSDDDGQTWKQARVPVDVTLTSIYFDTASVGWAVGHFGVILSTDDGGLTWTKSKDGLDVIDALLAAEKQGEAIDPSSASTALKQRVATAFQRVGPSKPFLAVGRCGAGILAAGQQDMAMFSDDGGQSWQEWTSKIDNPQFDNIYDILEDGTSTLLIGEDGLVLRGDGNCMNFKAVPGPYNATLFGGLVTGKGRLILYGLAGSIFETTDDGASWEDVSVPTDSNITAGLELASGRVLLSAFDGNLYISKRDSNGFDQLPISVPFQISDITTAPNGDIVIVGNAGAMVFPSLSLR